MITQIGHFNGKAGDDAHAFLSTFERHARFMGLSDPEKACSFPITLRADGAVWFEALEDEVKDAWTELEATFRNQLSTIGNLKLLRNYEPGSKEKMKLWRPMPMVSENYSTE